VQQRLDADARDPARAADRLPMVFGAAAVADASNAPTSGELPAACPTPRSSPWKSR